MVVVISVVMWEACDWSHDLCRWGGFSQIWSRREMEKSLIKETW